MIRIESSYFEAYTFEDFDLNGDGYITREEFNEAFFQIVGGGNIPHFWGLAKDGLDLCLYLWI